MRIFTAIVVFVFLFGLDTVLAQETTEAVPAGDAVAQAQAEQQPGRQAIEEITVTARRREERLQDTPVAVTALSAMDLREQSVGRLEDIMQSVPNLMMDSAVFQTTGARLYMRGVGNGDPGLHDDNGVGVYIDGVIIPRAQAQIMSLTDIERIESMRGPQGTLYGKNTIGGAINIITAKPEFEFGGYGEVLVGNFHRFETKASVNIPLVAETLAARFTVTTRTRDGYVKTYRGADRNDEKLLGGRAAFRFTPSDDLEFLWSLDGSKEDQASRHAKCKFLPTSPAFPGFPPPSPARSNPSSLLGLLALLGPTYPTQCLEDEFQRDELRAASEIDYDFDEIRTFGTSLVATWDLSPTLSLKSTSGFRGFHRTDAVDFDGVEAATAADGRFDNDRINHKSWSQDLTLTGTALDERLAFTIGLYGDKEKNTNRERGLTFPFLDAIPSCPILPGGIPCSFLREFVSSLTPTITKMWYDNYSYSAYGQGTYDVTEQLSVTLGARFTHERRRHRRRVMWRDDPFVPIPMSRAGQIVPGDNYDKAERFHKWTPMFNLRYRFTDDFMMYGGWSRGFKSGLWDDRGLGRDAALVEPELLGSWEIGLKSSWLDGRLILNAAYFRSLWEEAQWTVVVPDPGNPEQTITLIENAGKAMIHGLEVELNALPFENFQLDASLGMIRSRYQKFEACSFGTCSESEVPGDPASGPLSNNNIPGTPNYQINIAGTYTLPLGDLGELRTRVSWFHEGKRTADVLDQHYTRKAKHGLLDARMTLALADGLTEISLFGRNLLDRRYFTNGINLAALGSAARFYAPPRTYGVVLRRSF